MYNDLVDVAWRAFVEIYEPYPSVVAMGAIQRAFIWFRFRFFACRLSVQFSSVQLRLFFSHLRTLVATAHPSPSLTPSVCCSAARWHVMRMQMWQRQRMWHIYYATVTECAAEIQMRARVSLVFLVVVVFPFFSDAHWNATTSRHQQARERGRGGEGDRPSVNSRRSFLFIRLPAQLPRKQPQAAFLCLFLFLITNSESCLRHNIQLRVDVCVFKHSKRTQNTKKTLRNDNNKFPARH